MESSVRKPREYRIAAILMLLSGLLPVFAVHAAYLVNIFAGTALAPEYLCMPYLEGCVSISRAARSGPGLILFKAMMLPTAVMLLLAWRSLRLWLVSIVACPQNRAWWIAALGMIGAVFLVLYVTALGHDGDWYRWQRRYGVTFYFGGTALAQLLLAWVLWPQRRRLHSGRLSTPVATLMFLVSMQWVLGVFSSVKRLLFTNPELLDRIENIIEWWFALPMATAFIAIGWLVQRSEQPG